MTRLERKLLTRNLLLGMILSLMVCIVYLVGGLGPVERWLYDQRACLFQYFTPPPTDKLVHLDIDDATLQAVGAWPWPRSVLGMMLEEIQQAGAKAVAWDVVFPEPQKPRYIPKPGQNSLVMIDDDAVFAHALTKKKNTLLATAVTLVPYPTVLEKQARQLFQKQINLSRSDFETRLRAAHPHESASRKPVNFDALFIRTRQQVMLDKILAILQDHPTLKIAALRQRILPDSDTTFIGGSPLLNLLRTEYHRAQAIRAIRRSAGTPPPTGPAPLLIRNDLPPIAKLATAAAGAGFVSYLPDPDGVVRSVPLWVYDGQEILPQLGLALACQYLGISPRLIQNKADHIRIPGTAQTLPRTIHVRAAYVPSIRKKAGMLLDIPWFGQKNNWQTMYDPTSLTPKNHRPLNMVYQIHQAEKQIQQNNRQIDKAVSILLDNDADWKLKLNPQLGQAYRKQTTNLSDTSTRQHLVTQIMADPFIQAVAEQYQQNQNTGHKEQPKEQPSDANDRFFRRSFLDAYQAIEQAFARNQQWQNKITQARQQLRNLVKDKAVLIGWTCTAAVADFVPTSLHHKCPGVVVHGAVFNTILTGESWKRLPRWINLGIILGVGLACTAMIGKLSPLAALFGTLLLGAGYWLINGLILFDWGNVIAVAGGPNLAIALTWSACTLNRFLVERTERARITRRFRSYVDPALVNYVIEHPDQASLNGERRELTVVFTDLANFTSLSEALQEQTVSILNQYMQLMVPIIRQHRGYVNKFLGDGIMFFFGAPRENPHHAHDAIHTAMQMQRAMVDFNRELTDRKLPAVHMRIGICTGHMIVGDAGSHDASDYTVLGDVVNLAARLESANKYTGTRILINERTCQLTQSAFGIRPVAQLQVQGKSHGVMVYEPLCAIEKLSDSRRQEIEQSQQLVNAFAKSDFHTAMNLARKLEHFDSSRKLGAFYHAQCAHYQVHPPGENFDGCIPLEGK